MTRRYAIALLLVAIVSTAALISFLYIAYDEEKRATVIRMTSGQEALSQRIAFFANAYAQATDELDIEDYRQELGRAIRKMRQNHMALTEGDQSQKLSYDAIEISRYYYFLGDNPFDRQIMRYLSNADRVYNTAPEDLTPNNSDLLSLNLAGTNYIPQAYSLITDHLKDEGERQIKYIELLKIAIWAFTIILLLWEVFFIFRPVTNLTRRTMSEMERSRKEAIRLQKEAEAAAETKARFLATMSHEIRTPLNAVIGMTSLLMREPLNPQQLEHAKVANESGQHLLALINDILDLSKIDAGRMELDKTEFEISALIDQCVTIVSPGAQEKGLMINTDIEPTANLNVLGDQSRLRQVLINLLGNAVKFTEQGFIALSVQADPLPKTQKDMAGIPHRFSIRISDTGIGIEDDQINKLFDDFSQVDNSTTRKFGGSGLGLAISKRLVTMMGGEVGVESELGVGSTFWIKVPLEARPRRSTTIAHPSPPLPNAEARPAATA